jgi:hypothetical protein
MMYVIARSYDPHEVNRYFMSTATPRIGQVVQKGNRYYRVLDIECVLDKDGWTPTEVRVKVARVV